MARSRLKHAPTLIAWSLITIGGAGIVIAVIGGILDHSPAANTGGIMIFCAAIIGGPLTGGYALDRRSADTSRIDRVEKRLDRIENEQLAEVIDGIEQLHEMMTAQSGNVRPIRRGG